MSLFFGIILAFISLILWGFSDLVSKIAVDNESEWKVLFFTQIFGGLAVLIIALFLADLSVLASKHLIYLILLGFLNVIDTYFFYRSMQEKGISLTSPISYSWALVTIMLGLVFYDESLTGLQWLAALLIISGVFVVSLKDLKSFKIDRSFIFAFATMVLTGIQFFILKIPNVFFGAIIATCFIKIFTALFSAPMLVKNRIGLFNTKHKMLLIMLLIGLLDAFGFLSFNVALNFAPVSLVSVISSAVPLLSVLLGVLVLKEKLLRHQHVGIATAITGLVLISV